MRATAQGRLDQVEMGVRPGCACCVVLASGGYPGSYEKGKLISGLDKVTQSTVFHAGTKRDAEGNVVTSGGRVLSVSSYGDSIADALANSYASIALIDFDGRYFRRDIGRDLMVLQQK